MTKTLAPLKKGVFPPATPLRLGSWLVPPHPLRAACGVQVAADLRALDAQLTEARLNAADADALRLGPSFCTLPRRHPPPFPHLARLRVVQGFYETHPSPLVGTMDIMRLGIRKGSLA